MTPWKKVDAFLRVLALFSVFAASDSSNTSGKLVVLGRFQLRGFSQRINVIYSRTSNNDNKLEHSTVPNRSLRFRIRWYVGEILWRRRNSEGLPRISGTRFSGNENHHLLIENYGKTTRTKRTHGFRSLQILSSGELWPHFKYMDKELRNLRQFFCFFVSRCHIFSTNYWRSLWVNYRKTIWHSGHFW